MLQKQDTALTLFITLQIVQLQFQCSYHPSTPIRLNKHFFWFRFIYGHKLKRKAEMSSEPLILWQPSSCRTKDHFAVDTNLCKSHEVKH